MNAKFLPMGSLSVGLTSQPLPVALQSLIAQLQDRVKDGADKFTLSRADGLELIQQLQRASEAVANPPDPPLVDSAKELKMLKARIRLGGYAAGIANDLKRSNTGASLAKHANKLAPILDAEARKANSAVRTDFRLACRNPASGMPVKAAVGLFAIRQYGRRNDVCHSGILPCKMAEDWAGLSQLIDKDLAELSDFLPDDEISDRDKWVKVIEHYRERTIEEIAPISGIWKEWQPPSPVEEDQDFQEPTDRRIFDLRRFPEQVRQHAFERSKKEEDAHLPAGTSTALGRRTLVRSDPLQSPTKRKASSFPDLGLPRKSRKTEGIESSKDVPPSTKAEQESIDELLAEFVKDLHALADKDTSQARRSLKGFRTNIEDSLVILRAKAGKKAAKADKTARRLKAVSER
jgi:hypothetical protein